MTVPYLERKAAVVHGGGFVGLTCAMHFAQAGWTVTVYDPDEATVAGINAGTPRAGEFLSYLDASVADLVRGGRLSATTDRNEARAPVHFIAVPTEREGEPDDRIVLDVLRRLVRESLMGTTILVESTLTPGTIDILLAETSRVDGKDLRLACCPRRDWFSSKDKNLETLPRVVGGVTPACTARAIEILSAVSTTILPTTYRTAELVKPLENALFYLPVMLCHQLALALPNHDVAKAAALATTHWRFAGFGSIYLGFGPGGRCIPLGPAYLAAAAARSNPDAEGASRSAGTLSIASEALDASSAFQAAVAGLVASQGRQRALVLGIAYRPGFRDAGRSPGLAVARRLAALGVEVHVADPMWSPEELEKLAGLPPDTGGHYDAVLLACPHKEYEDWPAEYLRRGQLLVDGQGMWAKYRWLFERMDVDYREVGRPHWTSPPARPAEGAQP